MTQAIQDFIESKRLALIGVSRDEKKFSRMAYKELKARGYQVYAVNPAVDQIDGEPCYPDLMPLREKIDGVLVAVSSGQVLQVLRQAAEIGVKNVWLQQQTESPEAISLGQQLGLNLVSGKCILMYAPPIRSYHAWHRGFMRVIGRL
ncbi:MAG: CoA-binding protein [Chloroflexi bacterium]|nr:CoA-binding protein [Chloroflexota bacterium]